MLNKKVEVVCETEFSKYVQTTIKSGDGEMIYTIRYFKVYSKFYKDGFKWVSRI